MSAARADVLEKLIRHHNQRYFIALEPEVSDDAFDQLVEELKTLRPDSAVLREIGASAAPPEKVWKHTVPMLSLEKCYDEAALTKWSEKWTGRAIETPKIDGVAAAFIFGDDGALSVAATRGNGAEGELCTPQMSQVADVPAQVSVPGLEVRGEVYMPLSVFREDFADRFANPRNTAAGALKQKDASRTATYRLRFFAYDVLGSGLTSEEEKQRFLEDQGFVPAPWRTVEKSEMQAGYEDWERRRDGLDYEIDGVVFKVNDVNQQESLAATAHHPRYALAYKLKTESRLAVLERVLWSVSRTGAITPVANIEPTLLSGVTVTRISLHNLGMIKKLGVGEGATLRVTRRGGVIPYVEEVVSCPGPATAAPSVCPSCGQPTTIDGDFLSCANQGCRDRCVGTLEHYAKVVGMDGFGRSLLEQAFDRGLLRTSVDFFGLTVEQLLPLERMGKTLATKLVASIQSCREQPLDRFLVSLAIPEVGPTVAAVLAAQYPSLEALSLADEEALAALDGVGAVIATHVVNALSNQGPLIAGLCRQVAIVASAVEPEGGPLEGVSFVFTGKLVSGDRKAAQARVRALGGQAPSGVTRELSYLVVGDEGSPLFGEGKKGSKILKAERYIEAGAPLRILSEAEFTELIRPYDEP